MTADARRRLGALAALAAGLFLTLTLLPVPVTGQYGAALGHALKNWFGIGAIGFPLVGLAVAAAGLDRLGTLNMKRTAALMLGLSLLVPFFIGVLGGVTAEQLAGDVGERALAASLTGFIPALGATLLLGKIGAAGALLFGLVVLSALTLATIGWHPLRRLQLDADAAPNLYDATAKKAKRADRTTPELQADAGSLPFERETFVEPAMASIARAFTPKPKPAKPTPKKKGDGVADEENELPPIDLLTEPLPHDGDAGEAQLDRLGQSLLETLKTFKVEGTIAGRTTGPVVTQFEVVPAAGVKAQRIIALADDLAITMRAPSIRVAPIPGKGAVGVEVPNPKPRMVTLRELFESSEWEDAGASLPVALGRDLEGRPIVADLAKMPHLLIAGATGSGKSVAINTIVTSLIYRYTPKELRLLMVDPKMVELSMYNALPHLRHKVVTNNNDAARVLKWAVFEMNRRYALLEANGARNLADFNVKVNSGAVLKLPSRPKVTLSTISADEETTAPEPPAPEVYSEGFMPCIVLIIDELADLMMTVQGEVETPLAMLAQKARAIGIHLILATQRPSVNVITGLIKANFPSRIAFRVASKVDSRTILDQNGAEALLGNGDMLFQPPGRSEPMRLQGAFIGTAETEKVMQWYEDRRAARIAAAADPAAAAAPEEDIIALVRTHEAQEKGEGGKSGDVGAEKERDALFRRAAEECINNRGGSTSLLQRRLGVGYGRAARIIDQLETAGILSPNDGNSSRPREVLIGHEQLDEYAGSGL